MSNVTLSPERPQDFIPLSQTPAAAKDFLAESEGAVRPHIFDIGRTIKWIDKSTSSVAARIAAIFQLIAMLALPFLWAIRSCRDYLKAKLMGHCTINQSPVNREQTVAAQRFHARKTEAQAQTQKLEVAQKAVDQTVQTLEQIETSVSFCREATSTHAKQKFEETVECILLSARFIIGDGEGSPMFQEYLKSLQETLYTHESQPAMLNRLIDQYETNADAQLEKFKKLQAKTSQFESNLRAAAKPIAQAYANRHAPTSEQWSAFDTAHKALEIHWIELTTASVKMNAYDTAIEHGRLLTPGTQKGRKAFGEAMNAKALECSEKSKSEQNIDMQETLREIPQNLASIRETLDGLLQEEETVMLKDLLVAHLSHLSQAKEALSGLEHTEIFPLKEFTPEDGVLFRDVFAMIDRIRTLQGAESPEAYETTLQAEAPPPRRLSTANLSAGTEEDEPEVAAEFQPALPVEDTVPSLARELLNIDHAKREAFLLDKLAECSRKACGDQQIGEMLLKVMDAPHPEVAQSEHSKAAGALLSFHSSKDRLAEAIRA